MNNVISSLFLGIRLGIKSIVLMSIWSPLLVVIHLYANAVERKIENWSLGGLPFEVYCFGGPAMVLLWFSLPYLLGGVVLAFLKSSPQDTFKQHISSALIGLLVGLIGNYFLANSWRELHISDWILVGLMEIWSIVIFVWVGNRVTVGSLIFNGVFKIGRKYRRF